MNSLPQRINTDADTVEHDLARLLLTVVELVRQLMERQALRRVDAGNLSAEQTENVGMALMRLAEAMDTLRDHFGIRAEELNLDLGPLGPLLPTDCADHRDLDKSDAAGNGPANSGSR
jgi:hypothetical protein